MNSKILNIIEFKIFIILNMDMEHIKKIDESLEK